MPTRPPASSPPAAPSTRESERVPPISLKAIAIAFTAEIAADYVISLLVFSTFAQGMLTPGLSPEEFAKVRQTVFDTTVFLPCILVLGTATTVLGAYLAARLAKRIPYYHGLAMGIVAIVFTLAVWREHATWIDYLGLLMTLPASLYGAHLARKHLPVET